MKKVVKATLDEATIIALLARVTFTETFGHFFSDRNDLLNYLENTFNVSKIEQSLAKSNNVFWLAYVNQLPVGYAKLKIDSPSPFLEEKKVSQLQKIYVLKDFLSQKVGFALQDALLQEAKLLGREHIWLSVLEENKRAIGFYLKNDFTLIGKHNFQIGKEQFEFQAMAKSL
ncbi:MAG: GNAT family N-acetyltransferase [Bacteroidota bacterium]